MDIYQRLKEINSLLWRELRTGVLASCHAGLYRVRLINSGEHLDWREVNRKTVSSLHPLDTSHTDKERRACLQEALDCIDQKLLIVQLAAMDKGDRISIEEYEAIHRCKTELLRLSLSLRRST